MPATPPIQLSGARVQASVRPDEGGVVDALRVDGRSALARTPWAETVVPHPVAAARTEADWVARWRGGWQLCFPTTGQADADATPAQGFHGVASQAPWEVVEVGLDRIRLRWEDALGLAAERTWRLTDDGLEALTSAENHGRAAREIAVAEHLVLGGDILAAVLAGATLSVEVPPGPRLAPLDYDGVPEGPAVDWPGDPVARWAVVDAATPARVAAITPGGGGDGAAGASGPYRVTVRGPHVEASVAWAGLPHALIWEELAMSTEAPWNGEVVALGLEPTSTPHGAGTAAGDGLVTLAPGARLDWWTALSVRWVAA
jgi:galactose mutarotase-like enzyme